MSSALRPPQTRRSRRGKDRGGPRAAPAATGRSTRSGRSVCGRSCTARPWGRSLQPRRTHPPPPHPCPPPEDIVLVSVPDPNTEPPDPRVFWPPGSGYTSQSHGSGSDSGSGSRSGFFYHHAKIIRKTLNPTIL